MWWKEKSVHNSVFVCAESSANYLFVSSFVEGLKYIIVYVCSDSREKEGKRKLGETVEDKERGNGKCIRVTV